MIQNDSVRSRFEVSRAACRMDSKGAGREVASGASLVTVRIIPRRWSLTTIHKSY